MRIILALPLLLTAACSVEGDDRNDSVTLEFNEAQIERTADDLGNAAERAGEAIENEVEDLDVDVDVDVNRNKSN